MGGSSAGGNQGGGGSPSSNRKAKKDLEVSGYEAAITKQNKGTKKEINKGLNITTSSNDNKRSGYKPADYSSEKDDTDAKLDMFNKGKKGNAKGTLAIINPLLTKGSEVTRNFYTTRVLKGKDLENFKSKSVTEQEAQYKSYLDGRLSGKTDAMGRDTPETMAGIDAKSASAEKVTTIPKVTTAPTEAEVDQSSATDTTAVAETKKVDDIYTRKRKTKARGRSMMTLTGPQGLKKDDKLTLGKPSLLGS